MTCLLEKRINPRKNTVPVGINGNTEELHFGNY